MSNTVRPIAPEKSQDIINRLRRIEGQVRGIQRMVEEGQDCRKIVHQISAIKSALTSTSYVVLECYTRNCLGDGAHNPEEIVSELMETLHKSER